jgi:hypothetical protein
MMCSLFSGVHMNLQISTEQPICHLGSETKDELVTKQQETTPSYDVPLDEYLFRKIVDDLLGGHWQVDEC